MNIQQWLDQDGSYRQGLELYQEAGGTNAQRFERVIRNGLITGEDKQALRLALQKLQKSSNLPTQTVVRTAVAQTSKAEPQSILQLRAQGRKMKKQESFIHAKMVLVAQEDAGTDRQTKLYELALQMMSEIQPTLDEIYDQIRDYEQNGILPINDRDRIIQETVQKMQKRESIHTRIYRLKGLLKKEKDLVKHRAYELELQEKEKLLQVLEEALSLNS